MHDSEIAVVFRIYLFSPTAVRFCDDSQFKLQSSGIEEHNGYFSAALNSHIIYSLPPPSRIPSFPENIEKCAGDTRGKRMNKKQCVGATLSVIKMLMNSTNELFKKYY